MRWTAEQMGDHTGRTVLVTGANSGIGFEVARAFVAHGAQVILAVRDLRKGEAAATRLAGLPGSTRVEQLNLASLTSVRALARRLDRPLDVLVNNAGVMAPPTYRRTDDGHELQFGTNHLGHFALTGLLLPQLLARPRPRVTTVSSIAHMRGDARMLAGNPQATYSPTRSYGHSKLANLVFAIELQRRARAAGTSLVSTAAHPGVSATNLFTGPDGMAPQQLARRFAPLAMGVLLPGPDRGAEAILYAATVAEPGSYTGPQQWHETRGPVGPAKVSDYARDAALATRLWSRSEELTGVRFGFALP